MSDIQTLLAKLQQKAQLEAEIFVLTENVKQHMVSHGLSEISSKAGKLALKTVASKKSKKLISSSEVQELESAIQAERTELIEANAKQIYELQKARDLAELGIAKLVRNEWIAELEAKLEQAKQQSVQEASTAGYLTIDVQLSEPDYAKMAGDAWFVKALREAKSLKPKHMTKSMLIAFLANYYKGYYPGKSLDEAWQMRIADHLAYWSQQHA